MKVDRIITMTSRKVRLNFLAFERSVRAVGCDLPILAIPYANDRFDLPKNSEWWHHEDLSAWLSKCNAHPSMAKYACLTEANFVYFDSDICLLEDFRKTIEPLSGFVVADTEPAKPGWTCTRESMSVLARKTSLWQLRLFNTGHFASDAALYSLAELKATCEKYRETCLDYRHHEQPGINLLVLSKCPSITNLCFPPYNMESTLAVDYPDEWESIWQGGRRPYFIHYAGGVSGPEYPISQIYYDYLTADERREWALTEAERKTSKLWLETWPLSIRLLNRLVGSVDKRFYVQPKIVA